MPSTARGTSPKRTMLQSGGELMRVPEARAFLGLRSNWVVYDLARQNLLSHRRIGRRVLFSRVELERWLAQAPLAGSAQG